MTDCHRNLHRTQAIFFTALLFTAALVFHSSPLLANISSHDAALQQKIQKDLHDKKYDGVTVSVDDGVATLSGTVGLYGTELDALKVANKIDGIHSVVDHLTIATPAISDHQLQQQLLGAIQMDRTGFGEVFDAISVQVQNGMVTLGGHVVDYPSKNSAVSLAQYTPGVKNVIDSIQLDPISPSDDQIRMAEFNSIYGYPPLSEYAVSPLRPIRISVQNGDVTLYGIVDTQMDKDAAGMRANIVQGIFHVTNDLMVVPPSQQRQIQASAAKK